MTRDVPVGGTCDAKFATVEDAFRRNMEEGDPVCGEEIGSVVRIFVFKLLFGWLHALPDEVEFRVPFLRKGELGFEASAAQENRRQPAQTATVIRAMRNADLRGTAG